MPSYVVHKYISWWDARRVAFIFPDARDEYEIAWRFSAFRPYVKQLPLHIKTLETYLEGSGRGFIASLHGFHLNTMVHAVSVYYTNNNYILLENYTFWSSTKDERISRYYITDFKLKKK